MKTILLISPYWKEPHRWMVSSYKLADLWQRLGYRVVVACMGDMAGKEIVSPTLTVYRKKDFFLPDPWNYGIAPGFTGLVRKIIKEEKPDIVVCNKILFWTSISVVTLRLRGIRTTLLTDALVGMTWWPRGSIPKIGAALYAWTLGWLIMLCADRMVFFHPQSETLLRRLGVWRKSQVIPTGIDPQPFNHSTIHPSNHLTITYIGRLESVKGVDDFLAAATSLKSPDVTIQVVGWFKENHPLVQQYEQQVNFTGLRTDIPEILNKTDIFVLPSYSEGLSNALMEAMASGCACVASNVGGNAYLIQNGISGFLFPAGDREALASHLRRLIEDASKRKMMGDAARKRIDEMFSWEVVGQTYRKLFEAL
ncbi:glycosyltransferase [Candidatus Peribacteria bacterium]|nr:glycosyltransferase [Candidatus Peribacteria bacterium]